MWAYMETAKGHPILSYVSGVLYLAGFKFLRNNNITYIQHSQKTKLLLKVTYILLLPCKREAMKAVATLLEHRRIEWSKLYLPSGIQPNITAATAARKPTTVAWTWKRKRRRTILKPDRFRRTTKPFSVIPSSYLHLFSRCKESMLTHFVEIMVILDDQAKSYASRKGFTSISETQE